MNSLSVERTQNKNKQTKAKKKQKTRNDMQGCSVLYILT
jgi:hypothetical protein